ncbi:MAG: glutamate-5-semialdehyde dehydrogenase [Myxococcota bacterium]
MSLEHDIQQIATRAKDASARCAELNTAQKNAWIHRAAERLEERRDAILAANEQDLASAREKGVATPLVNRLAISENKWRDMIAGLRDVAHLPDPVGRVEQQSVRPNGLRVGRMRIPLGVIGIIYESRPNVTVDAASLCVKAGNAVILRGGSEALHSNLALGEELRAAARETDVPEDAICIVPTTDREAIDHLIRRDREIDLIIPRGGPGLIKKVSENSTIPVIKHDAGVCHVYLDASADPEMAAAIVVESKMKQMAVCNALETLLCHQDAAATVLPRVLKALHEEGVEVRGDARTCEVFGDAVPASEADWTEEFLAPIVACRVVAGMDEAVDHIRRFGSDHTEVIVTESYASSEEFLRRVTSSVVGVNCSTAFSDGFQLGLGAEIGISTSKLHAYGPMGLEGLTTLKFVMRGDGQLKG